MSTQIENLLLSPSQAEPYGPGVNMPAGYNHNWTQPGLTNHTNLEWRGADNLSTVLTGIDATDIAEGAVRIFNNATNSPGDAGSVVLVDEGDPRAAGSLAPNRICTPNQMDHKVGKQESCVLQRRRNNNGDLRWVVLAGTARKMWLWVQSLGLYPHLQVGTPAAPVVGAANDWNPAGVPFLGSPENLTVDGGDASNSRTFTAWNVFVDAAGLSVTGFFGSALNGEMTDWGPLRLVFNSGPGTITFRHLNAGSAVENRLVLPNARDYILPSQCGAWFWRPYLDEGLGITVQWRMLGVSNEVFPSVNTIGRTTTQTLTLAPPLTPVALGAGITSDYNPGFNAVIELLTTAPCSRLDGLVPDPSQGLIGNEIRVLRNRGVFPLVLIDQLSSASAVGSRFQLAQAGVAGITLPSVRVVAPGEQVILMYQLALNVWFVLDNAQMEMTLNSGNSILPAVLAAGNVNDYNPTDAGTGMQGRFSRWWIVQGQVGTNLTGIEASPAGLPPFRHGDRVLVTNVGSGLTIVHASAASAPGNRIFCPGGAGVVLSQFGTAEFIYDRGAQWYVLNRQ